MEEEIPQNDSLREIEELTGKEKYLAKKAEKEKAKVGENTMTKTSVSARGKIIKNWIIGIIVAGGAVAGVLILANASAPKEPDHSRQFPIQGREHIAESAKHDPYNSNPPSSGPHYDTPAPTGFYDVNEALPDEKLVHNLEHGEIWIAYKPDISPEIKEQIKNLSGGWIIAAPREANEEAIALVAWGRVDSFDVGNGKINEQRVKDFIKRYRNRGPENVPPDMRRSKN